MIRPTIRHAEEVSKGNKKQETIRKFQLWTKHIDDKQLTSRSSRHVFLVAVVPDMNFRRQEPGRNKKRAWRSNAVGAFVVIVILLLIGIAVLNMFILCEVS